MQLSALSVLAMPTYARALAVHSRTRNFLSPS